MIPGAVILALGVLSWILAALITRWTPAPVDRAELRPGRGAPGRTNPPQQHTAPHRPGHPNPAPTDRGHRPAPNQSTTTTTLRGHTDDRT